MFGTSAKNVRKNHEDRYRFGYWQWGTAHGHSPIVAFFIPDFEDYLTQTIFVTTFWTKVERTLYKIKHLIVYFLISQELIEIKKQFSKSCRGVVQSIIWKFVKIIYHIQFKYLIMPLVKSMPPFWILGHILQHLNRVLLRVLLY